MFSIKMIICIKRFIKVCETLNATEDEFIILIDKVRVIFISSHSVLLNLSDIIKNQKKNIKNYFISESFP